MPAPRPSVMGLAVLSMLAEEPMHPYRMHQLIKERRKDDVVNVSARTGIYQTIERLRRDGQLEVHATERADNRPERTTYRITDAGQDTLRTWLRAMLATPAAEYPQFPAALSFVPSLARDDAVAALEQRLAALQDRVGMLTEELAHGATFLPRVFLIETEYQQRMLTTELAYVQSLVDDLRSGRVSWVSAPAD